MEITKLEDMFKGWFIGDFEPSLHKTTDVEVGIKYYNEGDYEHPHFHKVATEFTVILAVALTVGGGGITTVGALVYPVPVPTAAGCVNTVITPPATVAVGATAPVPPPPLNVIVGAVKYPAPPAVRV